MGQLPRDPMRQASPRRQLPMIPGGRAGFMVSSWVKSAQPRRVPQVIRASRGGRRWCFPRRFPALRTEHQASLRSFEEGTAEPDPSGTPPRPTRFGETTPVVHGPDGLLEDPGLSKVPARRPCPQRISKLTKPRRHPPAVHTPEPPHQPCGRITLGGIQPSHGAVGGKDDVCKVLQDPGR
jgi:hypothetical protein